MPTANTDVLIVGGGPVGLVLACDLYRWGVSFRILDKKTEPERYTKAGNLWPRTQEALAAIGVLDRLETESYKMRVGSIYAFGKFIKHVSIEGYPSPHPTPLILGQNQIECILSDYLTEVGNPVERGASVVGLGQYGDHVEAVFERGEGSSDERETERETIRARYLVGCDGPYSVVRDLAKLSFNTRPLKRNAVSQMDAKLRWSRPLRTDQMYFFFFETGELTVMPLPTGYHRV